MNDGAVLRELYTLSSSFIKHSDVESSLNEASMYRVTFEICDYLSNPCSMVYVACRIIRLRVTDMNIVFSLYLFNIDHTIASYPVRFIK